MKQLLINNRIYDSEVLQKFILSLETRYPIETAEDKYYNLVNFSTNTSAPYHQWFKYREGFSSELITELLSMSGAQPGECIIDPFCGCGTTNVVSILNGYDTLGLDVNPMAAFLTNTKINHYEQSDLDLTAAHLAALKLFHEYNYKKSYENIQKYFKESNYKELIRIKTFLDTLPDSKAKNILFVAFESIIIDCSDRKRDGNGLKLSPSKVVDVLDFYQEKVNLILHDIKFIKPNASVTGLGSYNTAYQLYHEYSKAFSSKVPGAIIFSPPYANSFDYFESYKLELVFGDYIEGMSGIGEFRKKAVRSFIGATQQITCDPYIDMIALEIENAIPVKEKETGKRDTRTRKVPNMIRGYFSDMQKVIRQCALTLPTGKKTYIVVAQSAYCGKIVPTDLLLAYLGEQEGFVVGRIIECRKARTSTQQLLKYPYLKTALRESIVELIKKS